MDIWEQFAKMNGMSPEEFQTEIFTVAITLASLRMDEEGADQVIFRHGGYVASITKSQ
ncbi:hypothetical protein N9878_01645 [bacterium]|nr:hypothetical protein [bacterium]